MNVPGFGGEEPDSAQGTVDGASRDVPEWVLGASPPLPAPVPVHSPSAAAAAAAAPRLTGKRLPTFPDSSERPLKRAGSVVVDEEEGGSPFEAAAAAAMSASPAPTLAASAGLAVDAHERMQQALAIVMSNPDLAGRVAGGMGFEAVAAVEEASREAVTMSSPFNDTNPAHSEFMDICGAFVMKYLTPVDTCAVRATSRALRVVANKHGVLSFTQVSHTLITDGLCQEYGLDFVDRLLQHENTLMVHVCDLMKVVVFSVDPKILVKVVKNVMGGFVKTTSVAPFAAWATMNAWVVRSMRWIDFMDPELTEEMVREAVDKTDAKLINFTKFQTNTVASIESGTKAKFAPRITEKVLRVLESYGFVKIDNMDDTSDRMACVIVKLMAKFQARGLSLDPEIGALRYIASSHIRTPKTCSIGTPQSVRMHLTLNCLIKTPTLPPFLIDVLDIAPKASWGKANPIIDALRQGNRGMVRVLARRSYSLFSNNPNLHRRTLKAAVDHKSEEMIRELVEAGFHITTHTLEHTFTVAGNNDISLARDLVGALFSDPRSLHSQCNLTPLLAAVRKYVDKKDARTAGWWCAIACEVVRALWMRTDADTTLRNLVITNTSFVALIYKILTHVVWIAASLDVRALHDPFPFEEGLQLDPVVWENIPGGDPLHTFFAKHTTLCFDVRDRLYSIAPPGRIADTQLDFDRHVRDALVHKGKTHGTGSLHLLSLAVPHLSDYLQTMSSFSDDLVMLTDFRGSIAACDTTDTINVAKRLLRWCGLIRKFGVIDSTDLERILQRASAITGSPMMPLSTVSTREVLGAAVATLAAFVEHETGRELHGPEQLFAEFDGDIGKAIGALTIDPTNFRNAHPAGPLVQIIRYTACISKYAQELHDAIVESDFKFRASFVTLHRASVDFMDIYIMRTSYVSLASVSNTVRGKGDTVWWFGRIREAQ